MSAIQQLQILESLLLQSNQYTGQQLLISNCIPFKSVWYYVVNILNEYDIRIQIVQVFNQCTMTTRTEYQFAIIAERFVFHIGSQCICARFLFRETYIEAYSILLGIFCHFFFNQLAEQSLVFGRNGKMYIYLSGFTSCIQRSLNQMFFQRSANAIRITMEFKKSFR